MPAYRPYPPTQKRSRKPYLLIGCCVVFLWVAMRHFSGGSTATSTPQTATSKVQAADVVLTCAQKQKTTKRVGLQVGHLKADELPDELSSLSYNFGASSGGVNEVDVNQDIAQRVSVLLKKSQITVDILPSTVPEAYCASAFVAIHADGNDVTSVHGFKVAPSSWDTDGRAGSLSDNIIQDYRQTTAMYQNATITDNMTQYYAFNYEKFTHAIDPETPGALIEVGFITNPSDRQLMVNNSQKAAQGIANGILDYLNNRVAPTPLPTPTP